MDPSAQIFSGSIVGPNFQNGPSTEPCPHC
jgi:hypothetical protein